MRLIVLLICLAIVVYTPFHKKLLKCNCFGPYLTFFHTKIKMPHAWLTLALLFLPVLFIFLLLYSLLAPIAFGLMGLLISTFVLLVCLGPYHLNTSDACVTADTFFMRANENIFAVIVWFIFLGPVGALGYRLVTTLRGLSDAQNSEFHTYNDHLHFVQALLDWFPIRVSTLAYALAGDFMGCFSYWITHVVRGIDVNSQLLHEGGMIALRMSPESKLTNSPGEIASAQSLIDRAVVITLIVVAIFTLGSVVS